jgi:hypothetical protein
MLAAGGDPNDPRFKSRGAPVEEEKMSVVEEGESAKAGTALVEVRVNIKRMSVNPMTNGISNLNGEMIINGKIYTLGTDGQKLSATIGEGSSPPPPPKVSTSTNPFDDEDEEDALMRSSTSSTSSTPSPRSSTSSPPSPPPPKVSTSTNPFGDEGDEDALMESSTSSSSAYTNNFYEADAERIMNMNENKISNTSVSNLHDFVESTSTRSQVLDAMNDAINIKKSIEGEDVLYLIGSVEKCISSINTLLVPLNRNPDKYKGNIILILKCVVLVKKALAILNNHFQGNIASHIPDNIPGEIEELIKRISPYMDGDNMKVISGLSYEIAKCLNNSSSTSSTSSIVPFSSSSPSSASSSPSSSSEKPSRKGGNRATKRRNKRRTNQTKSRNYKRGRTSRKKY